MDIEVNHSKHSSILCLDDILSVESFKIMEECEHEEQEPYIDVELDVKQPSVISQPTEPTTRDDANIEDMVLEGKEEIKKISNKDSSPIWSEDVEKVNKSENVVDSVNFEVGLIGPHSKHFSTLYLDDILSVELFKIVEECEDEEK